MSVITLSQAQAQLDAWIAASLAIASSQSYTIGTQTLTRANADVVMRMIDYWEKRVSQLSSGSGSGGGGGVRLYGVTPC